MPTGKANTYLGYHPHRIDFLLPDRIFDLSSHAVEER